MSHLNYTEQSHSWEDDSRSTCQEVPRLLWNLKILYRDHKSPPLVSNLKKISLFCFSKIHCNILSSTPRSSAWFLAFRLRIFHLYACYMPRPYISHIIIIKTLYSEAAQHKSRWMVSELMKSHRNNDCCHPQVAEDPIIHQLYMRHIAPHKDSLPVSHLEGCRRVCSWHRYVYIHFVEFFQKRRNELKCELTIVPGAFITVAKSIALVRDSPYVGLFRHR
jgi:hypothetical protein